MYKLVNRIKIFKYELLIFLLFVFSRLPKLGSDMFNTDVWKWKQRIYDFGTGVFYFDFVKTIQKYHPGVILMWLGTVAVKFYNLYYRIFTGALPPDDSIKIIFELHFVQKLFVVCVIGIVLASIFYVLKKLYSLRYAALVIFLISLEPFYIALTRVLHLEGLMSTFMLASFVWLFYYTRTFEKLHLFMSAFFSACAILTKSSALFMLPFCALVLFGQIYWRKRSRKSLWAFFRLYISWFMLVFITTFVLWPALWVNPLQAISTVYRGIFTIGVGRGHEQIFFGKLIYDPGWGFYPLVLFYKSSPYLLFGLVAYVWALYKRKVRMDLFILYAILFSLLYLLEISIPSKKLDRYILPSLLGLNLVAAVFYVRLLGFLSRKLSIDVKKVFILMLAPAVFLSSVLHPDYFSYFNPFGGGLRVGIEIFEPKWIIGHHEVVEYLEELREEQNLTTFGEGDSFANTEDLDNYLTVAFPEKYYTQIWPFVRKIGGWAVIEWLTPEAKHTRYFVYPVWNDFSANEQRFKLEFMDKIYLRGVHVFTIYERVT